MTDSPRLRIPDLPGARAALQQEKLLRAISTHPEMTSTMRRMQTLLVEPAMSRAMGSLMQAMKPQLPDLTRSLVRGPALTVDPAIFSAVNSILADLAENAAATRIFRDFTDTLAHHMLPDVPPLMEPIPGAEPAEPEEPDDDLDPGSTYSPLPPMGFPQEPGEPSFTREQVRLMVVWYVRAVTFLLAFEFMLTNGGVSGVANTAFGVSALSVAQTCAAQVGKAFDWLYPPDDDEED
ncbi:hypothetical protein ACQP10_38485 (plasmid) [Streptosporangium sandarakinum]|uniref:hypothetical protein n=1 Tax=Streptosporangium sandarakinum TaxID=1260955 RepID=UPI003D8EB120